MTDYDKCPSCGQKTPKENLNCIYCGEVIYTSKGFFSWFHSPAGKKVLGVITLLVLLALLRIFF